MPSERMDHSPKLDVDLSESNLSFLSNLSSGKDEDSMLLSDQLNINILNSLNASSIAAGDVLESAFDLNLDKGNSDICDKIMTSVSETEQSSALAEYLAVSESLSNASSSVPTCGNFVFPASPMKNTDLSAVSACKIAPNPVNKQTGTQVLILQKPSTNASPMVMQAKNLSSIASASNVTILQPSGGASSAPKILTLPPLSTGNSLSNPITTTMKSGDVKILVGQVPGTSSNLTTTKQVNSCGNSSLQIPLKRAVTPSSTGQVITKVIITNNAATNQSLVTPVSLSANVSSSVVSSQPQSILLASPNKTFTLSRNVNTAGSQQILRTIPGTPSKQGMFVLSPVKTVQKLSNVPITFAKSPRRIAPATNPMISSLNSGTRVATVVCPTSVATGVTAIRNLNIQQSPTKVILKSVNPTVLKPIIAGTTGITTSTNFSTVVSSVQQSTQSVTASQPIQVPGSKFHYVRLVSAPTTSTTSTGDKQATLITASSSTTLSGNLITVTTTSTAPTSVTASQSRTVVPIAPAITSSKLVGPKQVGQRILIPAGTGTTIRPTNAVAANQLSQLAAGTLIPVGSNSQSYVMLPAQYVTQLQQSSQNQVSGNQVIIQHQNILPAPTVTSSSVNFGSQPSYISITTSTTLTSAAKSHQSACSPGNLTRLLNVPPSAEADSRPRKPCNCTKSQCLKLYCDCFANGEFCNSCNCNNCYNNLLHEEERQKAIKACLDRNPMAFHPKIGKGREGDQERRHTKGCNCKRSGCLKNYCECYEAKILCTNLCKCIGCKNFEDSSERKTLMHLADAAEVRVQQQAAAKSNLSSHILDMSSKPPFLSRTGERLPFAFVTDEVLQATCLCLLAQAEDGERSNSSEEELEKLVLQEFGRCLVQIIDSANKTKASKMDVQ